MFVIKQGNTKCSELQVILGRFCSHLNLYELTHSGSNPAWDVYMVPLWTRYIRHRRVLYGRVS